MGCEVKRQEAHSRTGNPLWSFNIKVCLRINLFPTVGWKTVGWGETWCWLMCWISRLQSTVFLPPSDLTLTRSSGGRDSRTLKEEQKLRRVGNQRVLSNWVRLPWGPCVSVPVSLYLLVIVCVCVCVYLFQVSSVCCRWSSELPVDENLLETKSNRKSQTSALLLWWLWTFVSLNSQRNSFTQDKQTHT